VSICSWTISEQVLKFSMPHLNGSHLRDKTRRAQILLHIGNLQLWNFAQWSSKRWRKYILSIMSRRVRPKCSSEHPIYRLSYPHMHRYFSSSYIDWWNVLSKVQVRGFKGWVCHINWWLKKKSCLSLSKTSMA
jgi:hypothetical protein